MAGRGDLSLLHTIAMTALLAVCAFWIAACSMWTTVTYSLKQRPYDGRDEAVSAVLHAACLYTCKRPGHPGWNRLLSHASVQKQQP